MTLEEVRLRRLAGQHLLAPADTQRVVKDLCGLQAQFLGHALHGLSIRAHGADRSGLVKGWTNRGTMHLFSMDDLPLFLHTGRRHPLRPMDTLESDVYISKERKAYFADMIVDAIAQGTDGREELKALCGKAGMGEGESRSLFDPWGGLVRALCEEGRICHKVQERKAYQLCPPFEPMEEEAARLEMARRYFTHFGPATIRDAAYFFASTQAKVKGWLMDLPVQESIVDGRACFYMEGSQVVDQIPACLFLAGFDQLMLGYEKTESLFLPEDRIRDIFHRGGIVRPAILVNGTVAGCWSKRGRKLSLTLFDGGDTGMVVEAAHKLWTQDEKIEVR